MALLGSWEFETKILIGDRSGFPLTIKSSTLGPPWYQSLRAFHDALEISIISSKFRDGLRDSPSNKELLSIGPGQGPVAS